jgi:hypothetical protein
VRGRVVDDQQAGRDAQPRRGQLQVRAEIGDVAERHDQALDAAALQVGEERLELARLDAAASVRPESRQVVAFHQHAAEDRMREGIDGRRPSAQRDARDLVQPVESSAGGRARHGTFSRGLSFAHLAARGAVEWRRSRAEV